MSSSSKICLTKRTFSDFLEGEEEEDCIIGNPMEEDDCIEQKTTEQIYNNNPHKTTSFGEFQSPMKRRKLFSSAIKTFFENTQSGLLSPSASNQKVQEILKDMKGAFPTPEELGMNSTRTFIHRYNKEKASSQHKSNKNHKQLEHPSPVPQQNNAVKRSYEPCSVHNHAPSSSSPLSPVPLQEDCGLNVEKDNQTKKVYTEEEVEDLLKTRESQLKNQYDKRLQELMGDMFEQFLQFNHDYIDKSYNDKECSYLS